MRPVTVSVGPSAAVPIASSWIRLDEWSTGAVGYQVNFTGAVNYTVQGTFDDPNSPTNPVPVANVTWINGPANTVGASTAQQGSYIVPPTYLRLLLNSGAGVVTMTVVQSGVAPY